MTASPLRFIIDVDVGKKVQSILKKQNYDVLCVQDIDPRMSGPAILEIAAKEKPHSDNDG